MVTQQSIEHAYWYSDEFYPALASCDSKKSIDQFPNDADPGGPRGSTVVAHDHQAASEKRPVDG